MIAHVRQKWSLASLQQAKISWGTLWWSDAQCLHPAPIFCINWIVIQVQLPHGSRALKNYDHLVGHSKATIAKTFHFNLWWSQTPRLLVSVSGLSLSTMWNKWVWNTRNVWKCLQSGGWSLMDCMPRHAPVFASGLLRGALRHLLKASLPQSKPSKSLGFEGLVKLQLSKSRDTRPTNRICM